MKIDAKNIKFARIGGLSPVKQKGYNKNMLTFHAPPCKKGVYAFLHPYYEPFLLGGAEYSGLGTKHSKFERIKDKHGKPLQINYDSIYEHEGSENWMKFWGLHYNGDDKPYDLLKPKKIKIFEHKGELWHHLGHNLKPNEILSTKGTWFLTNFNEYVKAVKKEFSSRKAQLKNELQLETNNPFGTINIDHLEVFIEKIK